VAERGQGDTADRATQGDRTRTRREPKGPAAHASPPTSALVALERAREHGRRAVSEALRALHAVVDAASLAATGAPAEAHRGLARLARALDDMAAAFGQGEGASLVAAVADALDVEIDRWEQRAAADPEARAVLRAYLGLRELLWELGVRRPEAATEKPNARRGPRSDGARRRSAIQRVPLEG